MSHVETPRKRKPRPKKVFPATVVHELVYYDGPQLLLLRSAKQYKTLGFAVLREGMEYPVLCAEVLERVYDRYMLGKIDLRFVFKSTPITRLYLADLAESSAPIMMRKLGIDEIKDGTLYPDHGIFSSVHTHPLVEREHSEDERKKFLIDGTWEARDFSRFYGRMHDVYSLQYLAKSIGSKQVLGGGTSPYAGILADALNDREWLGGGDYLSFYGNLNDRAVTEYPLRVSGIEYHSPGYVELAGRMEILDEVTTSIQKVIKNLPEIVKNYTAIRTVLRAEGILAEGKGATFSNEDIEKYASKLVSELCTKIDLPNAENMLKLCEGNVLLYAKVVMSYFRRVKILANFYVEGRVRNG